MRSRNILLTLAAGFASAFLVYFGTGLHPVWWLVWLAPIPVLALAPRLGGAAAFILSSAAWFAGELNEWNYFSRVLEVPVWLAIAALGIPAIVFGLAVLFARGFLRARSLFAAAFAFPALWVTYEFVTAISSPNSTFGNLAYTQMNFLPIIQIASITGIWAISFVVFLFASTVAALLSGGGTLRQRRALAIVTGVIICSVLLFGIYRLRSTPPAQSVAVTLLAKDEPMSVYLGPEQQALELLREYADEIRRATPAGTQAVVLPEKIARIGEKALPEVDAMFSSAAAQTQSSIVVGLVRRTPSGGFNSARYYSPDGKLGANYDKHHLLPGVEPEKPGHARALVDQPSGRWALQICKDMDFPKLSREYARDGAVLLLVPAWDFNVDRWLHARMAVLRAVENGFALARAARNGLLTVSDNRGRIVAEKATEFGHFVSVNAKVNVDRETTFYTATGDWMGWLCAALFVFLLIFRFRVRPAIV